MNSLVVLFNSEACQSLGVIKREASGKALSGLVRSHSGWIFTNCINDYQSLILTIISIHPSINYSM
jgi:hypothetical protein